jgi:uncharacterized membrane protein YczE
MSPRLTTAIVGLVGFGASLALMVRAELGLGPWDVLHQGVAERMGFEIGTVVAMSAVVLVLWVPLRQRPGLGTVANVVLVGLAANATLTLLPAPDHLAVRLGLLAAGVIGNGAATVFYIGAGLGPGPRDGLMTGLAQRGRRSGWRERLSSCRCSPSGGCWGASSGSGRWPTRSASVPWSTTSFPS